MDCKFVRQHLDAYVDAELEPTPVIEFERHLDVCSGCRNELSLARLVQRTMRELPRESAPPALEGPRPARARRRRREPAAAVLVHARGPYAGVLAAAGMVMLVAGAVVHNDGRRGGPAAGVAGGPGTVRPGCSGTWSRATPIELPTEIAAERPEQVTNWFRGKVGFRVRSVEFTEPKVQSASWAPGCRTSAIARRPSSTTASGDSRMTGVVFQSPPSLQRVLHNDQLVAQVGAHRERIGSRVVTYRNVQGYTVPILEHDGITYAFTGDLDQQQLLRLVASARLP